MIVQDRTRGSTNISYVPSSRKRALSRRPLRHLVAVAAAFGAVAATTSAGAHVDPQDAPAHLHLGEVEAGDVGTLTRAVPAVDWQTPMVTCDGDPGPTAISAPPTCDDGLVFTWTVEVDTASELLRVDWDQPYRQDSFALRVTDEDGTTWSTTSANTYSRGVSIDAPGGTYTIELQPERTVGTIVRLRAGAVDAYDPDLLAGDDGALLPNLRATPPFEFGFVAPINPLNSMFLASDDLNPGVELGGQQPMSCTADEVQEASDPTRNNPPVALLRCLRFTSGPHNVGPGHLDLKFPIRSRTLAGEDLDTIEEMTQVVHHADGSRTERDAGTWEYHATHGHYHYVDVLYYELYAVRDASTGELEQVGIGRKSGLCPADQGYGAWTSYAQSPQNQIGSAQQGSCLPAFGAGDHAMGISSGWGDYYRWQRPGQYVDFSTQGDGLFVVRVTIDVLDNVLETDETDNASYALVRITGNEVEILERGQGSDPWDPAKLVHDDGRI